jgi:DNA-binding transcriptional MerR regulator/effector-binding domain-containing protein
MLGVMFSIGEFARLGGVSVRTLRHYDEIGLLRPSTVDQDTGYRGYSASQLGPLNRIVALKDLGLSLTQIRQLLDGITLDELHGMLILRRAQLEHEVHQHMDQLLGVEARLRYIASEGAMPADDIVAKTIPEMGVVVLGGKAPAFGPENIVPVVNRLDAQSDQLGLQDRVKATGPRIVFYEHQPGEDVTVCLALPVAEPPGDLPAPARYRVLPEIEAATTVRSGPAASIFPVVYHDLVRWIDEHGHGVVPVPGREVWLNEVDDVADVAQQVFEIQLPFTRMAGPDGSLGGSRRLRGQPPRASHEQRGDK